MFLKLKPVFRCIRKKGLKGTKRTFQEGGDLGFHGTEINTLLNKMSNYHEQTKDKDSGVQDMRRRDYKTE